MDVELEKLMYRKVTAWFQQIHVSKPDYIIYDREEVAEVWGDTVFGWHVEILSSIVSDPIVVEFAIDSDGFVGISRIDNVSPHLFHLYPPEYRNKD